MQAITVRDRAAGTGGLALTELPYPEAGQNDVIVRVHAAGFTPGELDWPGTWCDRAGRDRTPSVPGHELSGVVVGLGFGTTGLTVGQRVFGLADWTRDGSLAEYAAVEARNLAPLPADVDLTMAAALPISGLTAWQGLFDHGRLAAGQTVLIHGAGGGVGSIAVQLARDVGARVIATGRAADRETALGLGAESFLDLQTDRLDDVGEVDVVFDVIGGEIGDRSAGLVRAGGTLVTIAAPPEVRPRDGRAVFFVVEPDRGRLADLAQRLREGRLTPIVGDVRRLSDAPAAFAPGRRTPGKTIIRVSEDEQPALAAVSEPPSETLSPLLETALPNVAGKTFTSTIVDFPPAARAAPHRHGEAFVYAYVLEGTVASRIEGEPVRTYHRGESWVEQPGAHHLLTENTSRTRPAKLLAVFVSNTGDELKVDDPPRST